MSRATDLDAADPLARFRSEFVVAEPSLLYLDGNSLGRMPKRTREVLDGESRRWSDRLVRGWNEGWIDLAARIGAKLGALIGAAADEVILADSTSVNLFKLACAALAGSSRSRRWILTDDLNFPSDLYVLESVARMADARVEVIRSADGVTLPLDRVAAAIGDDTALVAFSHTAFKSGFRHDLAAVTALAHERGALVLWDLSHSVGAMPIELAEAGADLAVGCTYKYLNGGPGAPAFLFVRRELQDRLVNPISGWLGDARPFDFALEHCPADGIRRFVTGTPPILSLAAVEPGVDLVLEAGVEAVRRKSVAQTEYLIELADADLVPLGFRIGTPRVPGLRGSHVALRHPDGLRIAHAAREQMDLLSDFRRPDSIRLGVSPLYTSFHEIDEAIRRLADLVRDGRHLRVAIDDAKVT